MIIVNKLPRMNENSALILAGKLLNTCNSHLLSQKHRETSINGLRKNAQQQTIPLTSNSGNLQIRMSFSTRTSLIENGQYRKSEGAIEEW